MGAVIFAVMTFRNEIAMQTDGLPAAPASLMSMQNRGTVK